MKNNRSLPRTVRQYAGIALGFAVLFATLRTVNLFLFFDSDIGYYHSGAALPLISHVLLALFLVGCAVASWICFRNGNASPSAQTDSLPLRIAAVVPAVGFFADAVGEIVGDGSVWFGLLSLGACLYFLLFFSKNGTLTMRVLSGFCVIGRLLAELASVYFDGTVPMNAPNSLLFQFACALGMLFFVCELRVTVSAARPVLYHFAIVAATVLLGAASVPSILAVRCGLLPAESFPTRYDLLFTLFVYTVARLVAWMRTPLTPVAESTAAEGCEPAESDASETTAEPNADDTDSSHDRQP